MFNVNGLPARCTTPKLKNQVICTQGFLPLAFGDPRLNCKAATLSYPGRGSILTLKAGVPLALDLPYRSSSSSPSPQLWSLFVTLDKGIALCHAPPEKLAFSAGLSHRLTSRAQPCGVDAPAENYLSGTERSFWLSLGRMNPQV